MMYLFNKGLTDKSNVKALDLGEGTFNFIPNDEGYLENYKGKTNIFKAADLPRVGTPPPSTPVTRVFWFRDFHGVEHTIWAQGGILREKFGNGYKDLYTFVGETKDSKSWPFLFIHDSKLLILNYGDEPLVYDGINGVIPLGVTEIPRPPELSTSCVPYSDLSLNLWTYKNLWWPGVRPVSGPAHNKGANGTTPVYGFYQNAIQFVDIYGNKGRISPASVLIKVRSVSDIDDNQYWLVCRWVNPLSNVHIGYINVLRTLNQNEDGGAGVPGVFYQDASLSEVTISRHTCVSLDSTLSSIGEADNGCAPPNQSRVGCSWKGRVFLSGGDQTNLVQWSDLVYFGQFRASQSYLAKDDVVAIVPCGDRLCVITKSSMEVLYDAQEGIGILEQDMLNGSSFGRSFVSVGGAIIGLFNTGFGIYDGQKLEFVDTPFWIRNIYLDPNTTRHTATVIGDWYYLTCLRNSTTTRPNTLLCFKISTRQWYVLKESVYDLCLWRGGSILGGAHDGLYQLFTGTPDESNLVVMGLTHPENVGDAWPLMDIRIAALQSSTQEYKVAVESEYPYDSSETVSSQMLSSENLAARFEYYVPYWGDAYTYPQQWVAQRDVALHPIVNKIITGTSHRIEVSFPATHDIRLKGLDIEWGQPRRLT